MFSTNTNKKKKTFICKNLKSFVLIDFICSTLLFICAHFVPVMLNFIVSVDVHTIGLNFKNNDFFTQGKCDFFVLILGTFQMAHSSFQTFFQLLMHCLWLMNFSKRPEESFMQD